MHQGHFDMVLPENLRGRHQGDEDAAQTGHTGKLITDPLEIRYVLKDLIGDHDIEEAVVEGHWLIGSDRESSFADLRCSNR